MTNELYRPKKLDDALSRISEECSEIIKIVAKAQRFGLNDTNPAKKRKNIDLLCDELSDLEDAREDFFKILRESLPSHWQIKGN